MTSRPFSLASLLVVAATTTLLASTASAARLAPKPKAKPAPQTAGPKDQNSGWSSIQALTPLESGPGLVVCEPVTKGESLEAAFSTGCAMWLQFTVGGHGELGRTPLWSSLERCRLQLGRKELRLTAKEAARLEGMLGITHVAVGEFEGGKAGATLIYRLLELPSLKAVGQPLQLSGNPDEITAVLPRLAQELLIRLRVKAPRVPETTGVTAAELTSLAGFGWLPERLDPKGNGAPLRDLAQRSPLAALLWLLPSAWIDDTESNRVARLALATVPDNALLCAGIIDANRRIFATIAPSLDAGRVRFPHNAAYAWADTWRHRSAEHWKQEAAAAELLVRCAPHNPEAWLTLGSSIGESANRIRNARYTSQMTEAELRSVSQIYDHWVPPLRRATQLDPALGRAWHRLAAAATFAGQAELADQAIQKAIQLDSNRYEVWWWALEMYSPKWFDQPEKLKKAAEQAAADRYQSPAEMADLFFSLKAYGFDELGGKLCTEAQHQAWGRVEREPNSADAHLELAELLQALDITDVARKELLRAVELDPEGVAGLTARKLLESNSK